MSEDYEIQDEREFPSEESSFNIWEVKFYGYGQQRQLKKLLKTLTYSINLRCDLQRSVHLSAPCAVLYRKRGYKY